MVNKKFDKFLDKVQDVIGRKEGEVDPITGKIHTNKITRAKGEPDPTPQPDQNINYPDNTIIRNKNTGEPTFVVRDGNFYPYDAPTFQPTQTGQQNGTTGGSGFIEGSQVAQSQQLAGEVGQFESLATSNDPIFDAEQGVMQGLLNAVPRAIQGLTGLSVLGGAVKGASSQPNIKVRSGSRALGTNPRALGINPRALGTNSKAIAAGAGGAGMLAGINPYVAGFALLATIASSMITEFKGQRTDTINAQKRVLDEGKQNLNDWATLAAADPANRGVYVKNFNNQLAQIEQAYRQMKLDTSRDVLKFETALPDLAEFEAFYSTSGERDFAITKMFQSLQIQTDPEYIYQMAELSNRRISK